MQYETIRAAICDDEEFFRNELKKFVSEYGNEMDINVSIDLYDNAKELMNNILSKSKEYDLLFLDVEMPGMTGIEMADALRKIDPWVCISFVTSYDAFAIQAFRLDALDYVMKPIKYTQVKHIIEKARIQIDYRKNAQKAEKRYLKIKSGYEDVLIDLQNVIYIEKRRNQCVFHKIDEEISCYEPLKNVYERLDNDVFMYIHQGYIANFNYIKEVKKDVVCFGRGMEVPLSRKYHDQIKELHLEHIRSRNLTIIREFCRYAKISAGIRKINVSVKVGNDFTDIFYAYSMR
mgnify:CR=1 FL=1